MLSTKHLRSLFGGHIATAQVLQGVATGLASAGVKVVIRGDIKIPHADPKTRKIFLPSQVKSEKALLVVNWWVDHEAAHLIWSPPYSSLKHRFKKIEAVVKSKGYPQVPTELMDMTHSLVNACEDARVENLMVERFPGCVEQFLAGPVAGGYDMQVEECIQEAADEDKKINAFWIAQWHAHALLGGWHGSKQQRFIRHIAPAESLWVLDIVEDNFGDIKDIKEYRCEDLADRADVVMSELLDKLLEPPQPQPQMSSSQSDDQSEEGEEGEGQQGQGQGQGQPDPNQEEQEGQPPSGPSPFDEEDDDNNNPATMPPPPSPKLEGDEEDGDDDQDQQGGGQDGEDKNEDKSEGDDQATGSSGGGGSEGSDEDDSDSGGGSDSGDDSEDRDQGQESVPGQDDGDGDRGSGDPSGDDEFNDDSNGDSGEGDSEDGDEGEEEDGSESEGEGSEDSEGEGEEGESSDGDSESDGDESDDGGEGDEDSDDDSEEDGDEGSDGEAGEGGDEDEESDEEADPVDPEQARNDLMDAVKQMAQDARSDRAESMAEALQNEVDANEHNPQPQDDGDHAPAHGSPPAVTPASDFHDRNMPDEYFEKIAGGAQIVTIEGDDLDLLIGSDSETFSEYDDFIRRLMPGDLGPVARRLMGRFKDTYGPAYAGSKINPRMHQRIKAGTAFGRKIMNRRIEDHQSRKGVCVQMVIDCSGSMCGGVGGLNFCGESKFAMAHAAARGLARYFQQLQIKFEVLGFTTDGLKDPDQDNAGSYHYRHSYSRSEDIINFVFKQFEEPWSMSEQRMLAMNHNTRAMVQDRWISSSTNSDGESVLWAALRMMTRPEQEKIMLVLSDGLPWAGNSQMQSDFLAWVVWRIQEAGIKIGGLGLGSDAVANYYPVHEIVNSVPPEYSDEAMASVYLQEKIISLVDQLA